VPIPKLGPRHPQGVLIGLTLEPVERCMTRLDGAEDLGREAGFEQRVTDGPSSTRIAMPAPRSWGRNGRDMKVRNAKRRV